MLRIDIINKWANMSADETIKRVAMRLFKGHSQPSGRQLKRCAVSD